MFSIFDLRLSVGRARALFLKLSLILLTKVVPAVFGM